MINISIQNLIFHLLKNFHGTIISFDGHVLAISGERKGDIGKKVDGYLTR
ncbi:MAG TPA: hypothetical protein VMW81_10285 [Nitrospinota bacterium]|nr:hypothetical protein [Nitrospinota bacterium]